MSNIQYIIIGEDHIDEWDDPDFPAPHLDDPRINAGGEPSENTLTDVNDL